MSDLEYWLWFSSLRLLRFGIRRALLERFGGAKGIYFAQEEELRKIEGLLPDELDALLDRNLSVVSAVLGRCDELNIRVITLQDAAYPERLRNIPDPPSVLYVRGKLPAVDAEPVVTIVGTRKCTPYGEKQARNIAYEVAQRGGIVCTGLAAGIDSRAAEGALMGGGPVIGVLGTAINEIYPRENRRLYEDVLAMGAILSEYPPDAKGSKTYFPARNRIMAGLSLCVVVVEAPLGSGSLITAHCALDYGRDVYAVPANVGVREAQGSNNLLREGAFLAENGWDVLREYTGLYPERIRASGQAAMPDELAIPTRTMEAERQRRGKAGGIGNASGGGFYRFREKKAPAAESAAAPAKAVSGNGSAPAPPEAETPAPPSLEQQLKLLNDAQLEIVGVMHRPGMHVDDIVAETKLPAAQVLSELTMLEIKGFVKQEAGKRFTLNLVK